MAKQKMFWHKECLKNWYNTLKKDLMWAERQIEILNRQIGLIEFYERQIKEAERRGKDGFDRDKFMRR